MGSLLTSALEREEDEEQVVGEKTKTEGETEENDNSFMGGV